MDIAKIFFSSFYTAIVLYCVYLVGRRLFSFSNADILVPILADVIILRFVPNPMAYAYIALAILIFLNRTQLGGNLLRKPHPLLATMRDPNKMVQFIAMIVARAPEAMLGSDFQSVVKAVAIYGSKELAEEVARKMDTGFRQIVRDLGRQDPEAANAILAAYTASDTKQIAQACETLKSYALNSLRPRESIRAFAAAFLAFSTLFVIWAVYALGVFSRIGF